MDRNDSNERDAAGVGPYARERETLTPLSSLESWKVSEGDPDIRGWEVRTVSGRELGCVVDLLVDADAGEVVLLDIDLPGSDQHTFVPIRVAQLDRTRRIVLMDSADVPEAAIARSEAERGPDRRSPSNGIVHYPRSDREIVAEPAQLADAVPVENDVVVRAPRSEARSEARIIDSERRAGDRRRIDRISSDF